MKRIDTEGDPRVVRSRDVHAAEAGRREQARLEAQAYISRAMTRAHADPRGDSSGKHPRRALLAALEED